MLLDVHHVLRLPPKGIGGLGIVADGAVQERPEALGLEVGLGSMRCFL